MVSSIDMTRIKRESYRRVRRDGLSEICSGLMLGMMALSLILIPAGLVELVRFLHKYPRSVEEADVGKE